MKKSNLIFQEKYIAHAVLLQSFLVILQQVLISVYKIPAEDTTIYRVVLTAIPLSLAIFLTMKREGMAFLTVYGISILILSLNLLLFPSNGQFLIPMSLRFLLPIVIPNVLCLMFLSNVKVIENALYNISWLTFLLTVFYVFHFFRGTFLIDGYNMSLSYGLLLPAMSLYSNKKWYSIIAAAFLLLTILAIGSRGAAVVLMVYFIYDLYKSSPKLAVLSSLFLGGFVVFLPFFMNWLETIGISSRTLNLFNSGSFDSLSSREIIYAKMIDVFWNHSLTGIGLFGDRVFLDGSYSHNLILEVFLNWGLIGGFFIVVFFIWKIAVTYLRSSSKYRELLVVFLFSSILPLMVSGSYLVDYNLGLFIGVLLLIGRLTNYNIRYSIYQRMVNFNTRNKLYVLKDIR